MQTSTPQVQSSGFPIVRKTVMQKPGRSKTRRRERAKEWRQKKRQRTKSIPNDDIEIKYDSSYRDINDIKINNVEISSFDRINIAEKIGNRPMEAKREITDHRKEEEIFQTIGYQANEHSAKRT